jgi:hypothetical protein
MEVYLDESGIHSGSKRCVLAGYSGGARKLKELEARWSTLLSKFKIPEREGFHAKTFFKRSPTGKRFGIYSGWTDQRAQDFIREAVHAINANGLTAVGGAVDIAYFNSLSHNLRRWLTGGEFDIERGKWKSSGAPRKPYFFAFQQCVVAGTRAANRGVTVDFVMDLQDQFKGLAVQMFDQMRHLPQLRAAEHLGRISFHSRFDRVGLQPADLLAFCMYHSDAYRRNTYNEDIRFAIYHLKKGKMDVRRLEQKTIELLTEGYPPQLRDEDEKRQRIESLQQGDGEGYSRRSDSGDDRRSI